MDIPGEESELEELLEELTPELLEEVRDGLPEEFVRLLEERLAVMEEERQSRLDALSETVVKRRREAVAHRKACGIEDVWDLCDDHYNGEDDASRADTKTVKPPTADGAFSASGYASAGRTGSRSTVFTNITRPYVDAASARISDMLLPTDDRNWDIKLTPMPELDDGEITPELADFLSDEERKQLEGQLEELNKSLSQGREQIDDWLVQCQYHAEVRKVFADLTRLGTSILRGPLPTNRTIRKVQQTEQGMTIAHVMTIEPESKRVNPRNFFPDPACGEDHQSGSYVLERDYLSPRQLHNLVGGDNGYIDSAIMQCLEEGPAYTEFGPESGRGPATERSNFEVWYYHGTFERDDLEAAFCECGELPEGAAYIPGVLVLVNDRVIRASISPVDTGDFPYDVMPYQPRSGVVWGIGVAEQISVPQKMVVAATRAMMDNAPLASKPQIITAKGVTPQDGIWEMVPGKHWEADLSQLDISSVSAAFQAVVIPSMQQELMGIIQYALKLAEDTTGMPMLLQGQLGTAPDTVGGMTMLNNNASAPIRQIARRFDDHITEPHIRRYYDWLMEYGEEETKGDYVIDARGSTALVERDAQAQVLTQMGALVVNPAFGIDPEAWAVEMMRAQRIDPKKLKLSDDKREEMMQQAMAEQQAGGQPQQQDSSVQVAELRSQTELQKAEYNQTSDMKELQFKAEQADKQREHDFLMKQMDWEMKSLEFAEKKDLDVAKLRAMLIDRREDREVKQDLFIGEANLKLREGSGI